MVKEQTSKLSSLLCPSTLHISQRGERRSQSEQRRWSSESRLQAFWAWLTGGLTLVQWLFFWIVSRNCQGQWTSSSLMICLPKILMRNLALIRVWMEARNELSEGVWTFFCLPKNPFLKSCCAWDPGHTSGPSPGGSPPSPPWEHSGVTSQLCLFIPKGAMHLTWFTHLPLQTHTSAVGRRWTRKTTEVLTPLRKAEIFN